MTDDQRAAYTAMLQAGRGLIADLNGLLIDIERGATLDELRARLELYANQGANRLTRAGGQLYLALSADTVQRDSCAHIDSNRITYGPQTEH